MWSLSPVSTLRSLRSQHLYLGQAPDRQLGCRYSQTLFLGHLPLHHGTKGLLLASFSILLLTLLSMTMGLLLESAGKELNLQEVVIHGCCWRERRVQRRTQWM